MKKTLWLILLLAFQIGFSGPARAWLQSGEAAPDFELSDCDGNMVRRSDFQDRIILAETRYHLVSRLHSTKPRSVGNGRFSAPERRGGGEGFLQENRGRVARFMLGKVITTTRAVLLDDGRMHRAYRVLPAPRLLIIDRKFRIVRDGPRLAAADMEPLTAGMEQTLQAVSVVAEEADY